MRYRAAHRPATILAAALLICLSYAKAGAETHSYMGVWADEDRTEVEVWVNSENRYYDIFIFLLPGSDGAFAVEYKLNGIEDHLVISNSWSPLISLWMGDYVGGIGTSVSFYRCQYEPLWIFQLTMYAFDNFDCSVYWIGPHGVSRFLGVAICPYPRPLVDAYAISEVWVNCPHATQESSWGAIKGLYRTGND